MNPRPTSIPRMTDHLLRPEHLYVESMIPRYDLNYGPYSWDTVEQRLQTILDSHGETPSEGTRFLVGREIKQVRYEGYEDAWTVYHDRVLTRKGSHWTRQLVLWSNQTPYEYDFDVFEFSL